MSEMSNQELLVERHISEGNIEEAIRLSNDSEYGLSAYLFTSDQRNIHRAIKEMEVGGVCEPWNRGATPRLPQWLETERFRR